MTSSLIESRTRRFYEWEMLGRGWLRMNHPISLEPPFTPFEHYQPALPAIDDGRRPSLLSRIAGALSDSNRATVRASPEPELVVSVPKPIPVQPIVEWELVAPKTFDVDRRRLNSWVRALPAIKTPISLTFWGTAGRVGIIVSAVESDARRVVEQTSAHFPDLKLRPVERSFRDIFDDGAPSIVGAVEFALAREFMLPMATGSDGIGILTPIVGSLARLRDGDVGCLQVMFQRAHPEWNEAAWKSVHTEAGEAFFSDMEEFVDLAREKCSQPLYAVTLRALIGTQDRAVAESTIVDLGSAIATLGHRDRNELTPLLTPNIGELVDDVLERSTHRVGCILSLSELEQLIQLPDRSVVAPQLIRNVRRTKAAPSTDSTGSLLLGVNEHDGVKQHVMLSTAERLKHVYVIGASGTGKSSLLLNMIEDDVHSGKGCAVLDPHGDLIDELLLRIPRSRAGDVVLFDPSDEDFPIGFNVLRAATELERTVLASDLVSVFKRFSKSFSDQMETVLGNAILALLERPEGGTLLELREFLIDKDFRAECLKTVSDREVTEYWRREYPLLKGNPHASILTRLNTFLRPRTIRNMVAQKKTALDVRHIMDSGKILLAKLSQGLIGEENAYVLGSLLVSQISQAAAGRQNFKASDRRAFFMYVDEFHHFITPSISTILSGARKYALGLTLAHQDLRQIKSRDDDLMSAVLGNAYTRLMFRVSEDDARALASGLSYFEASDLQNLQTGECIGRIERPANDFNLRTKPISEIDVLTSENVREEIIRRSRSTNATPRHAVESLLGRTPTDQAASERTVEDAQPKRTRRSKDSVDKEARLPGRGGNQHRYLQARIVNLAEECGFIATREQSVIDGAGFVDVALHRDDITIAFEISVTTPPDHEANNIHKCLAAGFNKVVVVFQSVDQRDVTRAYFSPTRDPRVEFLMPDQLDSYFAKLRRVQQHKAERPSRNDGGNSNRNSSQSPKSHTPLMEGEAGTKYLMIAKDAATYLGIAYQTLSKWRLEGKSPEYHTMGRSIKYDVATLDKFIEERRRRSTSDDGSS